jgi:L-amino acid N-acyltransferase YncA
VTIRPARADDLPAVAAIYNAGIAERVATFETRLREPGEVASWLHDDGHPFLVAERDDGRIAGWARATTYSSRGVYAGVAEHAVYVDPDARGAQLGRTLLEALATSAEHAGLHKLTGRIFADNAASIAAHRAAGFDVVGVQRRHARLDGEWKDCVLVERLLGPAAQPPPGER